MWTNEACPIPEAWADVMINKIRLCWYSDGYCKNESKTNKDMYAEIAVERRWPNVASKDHQTHPQAPEIADGLGGAPNPDRFEATRQTS